MVFKTMSMFDVVPSSKGGYLGDSEHGQHYTHVSYVAMLNAMTHCYCGRDVCLDKIGFISEHTDKAGLRCDNSLEFAENIYIRCPICASMFKQSLYLSRITPHSDYRNEDMGRCASTNETVSINPSGGVAFKVEFKGVTNSKGNKS